VLQLARPAPRIGLGGMGPLKEYWLVRTCGKCTMSDASLGERSNNNAERNMKRNNDTPSYVRCDTLDERMSKSHE
jgi:hypothetical protein